MTYGAQSRGVDRCTRSRPTATQWQRETMSGKLLPMQYPKRSLFARIWR